jgi:3-phenylpropionate/cinnamic acid dioxygenase small subunit
MNANRRIGPFRGGMTALAALLLLMSGAVSAQTTAGLAERIDALESREQIRNLIIEYGRALDHRDFFAYSALFEEEQGTWVGGLGSATGRDAIFKLMDGSIGHAEQPVQPTSHHVFSNIRIDVDGDSAAGTTRWTFVVQSEDGNPQWFYLGHYDDQFVRKDGQWYFLRREAFTDIPRQ